jgi:hypothetical protein
MTIAPAKFVHVVYRTRRFDEMIEWYKTVFGAWVQFQGPAGICSEGKRAERAMIHH